jgi:transcriptional regulator with XRE-family HTH domain
MDDVRAGRLLRALRRRRGLRQIDLAVAAGLAQSTISLIERGHLDRLAIRTLRTVFAVVDARFDGGVAWRGGAIDASSMGVIRSSWARWRSSFGRRAGRSSWR